MRAIGSMKIRVSALKMNDLISRGDFQESVVEKELRRVGKVRSGLWVVSMAWSCCRGLGPVK